MKAIVTKYHGPAKRGSYMSATADGKTVRVSYDHALNSDGNHAAACRALLRKLGWSGAYASGGLPNSARAWVYMAEKPRDNGIGVTAETPDSELNHC